MKDRIGMGGDLSYPAPVTREARWEINLGAMKPGALVQKSTGLSHLQARGYTSLEAEF